jgi:hypothetical protein
MCGWSGGRAEAVSVEGLDSRGVLFDSSREKDTFLFPKVPIPVKKPTYPSDRLIMWGKSAWAWSWPRIFRYRGSGWWGNVSIAPYTFMACGATTVCLSVRSYLSIYLYLSSIAAPWQPFALFIDVREQISGMWAQRRAHEIRKLWCIFVFIHALL